MARAPKILTPTGILERVGIAVAEWMERWFPDAFVFALLAVIIAFLGAWSAGTAPLEAAKYFGSGFWSLIPFTMQMAMIVIGGYVLATTPVMTRLIRWLAARNMTGRQAVALVALFSTTTSLISWGFSLVISGLLVLELLRRNKAVDYRAAGAAAYLGLGSVWALGLSSSAALMMSTPSAIPPALVKISGVIPLAATILTWQSGLCVIIVVAVSVAVAFFSAPSARNVRSLKWLTDQAPRKASAEVSGNKMAWLETTPVLTIPVCALGLIYLGQIVAEKGWQQALDLNTYNLMILLVGFLLHWTPRSFVTSVADAVPATSGILIQFPFYAGVFALMTQSPLTTALAHFFTEASTQSSYPVVVAVYSGILGLLIPSGGSKWVIEAPYILAAAKELKVNLGWVVQIYNASEALPNLINPFFMLPILGIMRVRARELVGYSTIQLFFHLPIVIFLLWILSQTLPYDAPVTP